MTKSKSATARFRIKTFVVDRIWWLVRTTTITRVFPMTPKNAIIPNVIGTIIVVKILMRLNMAFLYSSSSGIYDIKRGIIIFLIIYKWWCIKYVSTPLQYSFFTFSVVNTVKFKFSVAFWQIEVSCNSFSPIVEFRQKVESLSLILSSDVFILSTLKEVVQ